MIEKNEGRKVTIIEVSQHAKVSISTVSRVINGSAGVRAEPKQRVLDAIEALGYQPSYSARLLKTQRSFSAFVLVPEIDNPYYTRIYKGARLAMGERGYMTFLFEATEPEAVLRSIVERGADGVILDARYHDQAKTVLDRAGIPFTCINSPVQFGYSNSVSFDLFGAVYGLFSRLYELGHEKLGFITFERHGVHPYDRFHALEKAAEDFGKPFNSTQISHQSRDVSFYECGRSGLHDLLEECPDISAVVADNDLMAIGALTAARERGLSIPQDLSIAGFDNSEIGRFASPPLTTVNLPKSKQGRLAAEMLLSLIEDPEEETYSVTLDTELLMRESVGPTNK